MKQLKEDFLLAVRLVYKKILFVLIYMSLAPVIFPESHRVIAVTNVTLKGAVLYLIVVYACIAMVLGVYSYSAVKEKIGETPSFVKRFAFIVGIQTVLFLTTTYLYDYVAESLHPSPIHYKIVYDGSGVGMIPESIQTVAMTLTVVVIILTVRRIMTGLEAATRK